MRRSVLTILIDQPVAKVTPELPPAAKVAEWWIPPQAVEAGLARITFAAAAQGAASEARAEIAWKDSDIPPLGRWLTHRSVALSLDCLRLKLQHGTDPAKARVRLFWQTLSRLLTAGGLFFPAGLALHTPIFYGLPAIPLLALGGLVLFNVAPRVTLGAAGLLAFLGNVLPLLDVPVYPWLPVNNAVANVVLFTVAGIGFILSDRLPRAGRVKVTVE